MLLEPHYNAALWAFKTGDYQEAISYIKKSLKIYPEHADSHMLMKNIEEVIKIMWFNFKVYALDSRFYVIKF